MGEEVIDKGMDINGKVTIITGASAGIGLATARLFAAEGARLVLAARSQDKLESLAAELRQQSHEALPIRTDVRDQAAVKRMVAQAQQHFGRIDILINNAGQSAAGTVAEISPEHFRQIIELNLYGAIYAIQAVAPVMRLGGGGLIINISSMVSKMHIPGLSAYASSKAALNSLSDTARAELAADNIRVVTVYPRTTATDFGKNALGDPQLRQQQRTHAAAARPPDPPEFVAGRILLAAQTEPAEQYME